MFGEDDLLGVERAGADISEYDAERAECEHRLARPGDHVAIGVEYSRYRLLQTAWLVRPYLVGRLVQDLTLRWLGRRRSPIGHLRRLVVHDLMCGLMKAALAPHHAWRDPTPLSEATPPRVNSVVIVPPG